MEWRQESREHILMKRRKFLNHALSTVAIVGSNSVIGQSIAAVNNQSIQTKREHNDITTITAQAPNILTVDELLALPNVPGIIASFTV